MYMPTSRSGHFSTFLLNLLPLCLPGCKSACLFALFSPYPIAHLSTYPILYFLYLYFLFVLSYTLVFLMLFTLVLFLDQF